MAPILGIWASSVAQTADTGAMFPLQVITVGPAGASSVEFTNIPSTYTHLQIRAIGRSTRASVPSAYINMQFNSDTGNNYTYHQMNGDGTTVVASGLASQDAVYVQRFTAATADANTFGSFILDILDYKNTNKYKTIRSLGGSDRNGSGQIYFVSSVWMNTNAITSIKFTSEATGDFAQYSQFALYGIKGA